MASVLSKLPIEATGTTVNRFCASGLQTVAMAANQIGSGYTDVMMAGGAESISMRMRQEEGQYQQNCALLENKPEVFMQMGNTAEVVARRYSVTRESQDEYALQSQQRYAQAVDAGAIQDEIVPMPATMKLVNKETGDETLKDVMVDRDECNRVDTTLDGLSMLKPAFEEGGSVTAGNSSQLSDGASMTLLMSAERAEQLGVEPLGYFSVALSLQAVNLMRWGLDPYLRFQSSLSARASVRMILIFGSLTRRSHRSVSIAGTSLVSTMPSTM